MTRFQFEQLKVGDTVAIDGLFFEHQPYFYHSGTVLAIDRENMAADVQTWYDKVYHCAHCGSVLPDTERIEVKVHCQHDEISYSGVKP